MINNVVIQGYKSLSDVRVALAPLSIVIGPNSAGKSNLLDALGLLSRMTTMPTLDAAFEDHRGTPLEAFTFSEGGVEGLQEQGTARFTISVDVTLSNAVVAFIESEIRKAREGLHDAAASRRRVVERRLRYTLQVEIVTSSGHLRVTNERLEALNEHGEPKASRRPFLEPVAGSKLSLRMEKQGHPTYEEVGQDRTIISKPLYPPHYPHIVAFREELSRWRFYYLEPSAMREEVPLKEVETLSATGADIAAFFNTMKSVKPRQFGAVGKALHQVIGNLRNLDIDRSAQGFLSVRVDESGMPISSRLLSEGTLRVLGLLAITTPLVRPSVVGYEEPENGVHPSRLGMVATLLMRAAENGETQYLINTHSPVLPEFFLGNEHVTLIRSLKVNRETRFEALENVGTLFQGQEIASALEDSVSRLRDRIVRGDLV